MGLLDSLYNFGSTLTQNLKAGYNAVGKAVSSLPSYKGSYTASVLDSFTPRSVQPNITSVTGGPAYASPSGEVLINTPQGARNVAGAPAANMSTSAGPAFGNIGGSPTIYQNSARPLSPTIQQPIQQPVQQQVSAPRQPTQTIYNTNPYGMATVGQSGQSGATAQNFSAGVSNGSVGSTGISGGVSNYTGTLGATGASSFPSGVSPLVADEETRKKQENAIAQQKAGMVNQPAAPAMGGFVLSNGDIYNSQTGQLTKASSNYSTIASPASATSNFSVASPNGPINADTIAKNIQDISSQLSTGKINAANAQEFYAKLDEYKNQLVQIEQQKNPITNQPHVVETPEQQAFLQSLNPSNRTGVQQQMDSVRQNLGLPTLEADIAKKRTELNAANKVFQEIVKDIRDNPELPAGLKAQRITDFTSRNGILISNLNAELQNLNAQRDSANEQLNQQFQIYKQGVSEQEAQLNRQKEVVNQYITSGAIANFSDASLQQIAAAGLYDFGALKSLRDSVSTEKKYSNVNYIQGDNGAVTAVGIDKNGNVKVLGSLGSIGKSPSKSAGDLSTGQQAIVGNVNKEFENSPIVKEFNEIQNKLIASTSAVGKGDGASDIAIIYDLMKTLDPTSVVREAEYETGGSKSGNIFAGVAAKLNGLIDPKGGFISEQAKQNIFAVIQDRFNVKQQQYLNLFNEKAQAINKRAGITNGADYLTQYDFYKPQQSQQAGQGTIKIQGQDVQVGAVITNAKGQKARVNADGTVTPI